MQRTSTSERETEQIAQEFAQHLRSGDIVLLYGELGAGKTTFSKALAKALGVDNRITSPTFALMNVYEIPARPEKAKIAATISTVIHIDTYRLEHEQELLDIGVTDYLGQPGTLTIIEWPEKVQELLKKFTTKKIRIETLQESIRTISVS